MVKEAAALNDAGIKATRGSRRRSRRRRRRPYMLAALKADTKAFAAWRAFSPSHQREYIEWITEANPTRRARRLETAVAWIAERKGRNWKYQR